MTEIKVTIYVHTYKQTVERTLAPEEGESHAQFAARVWDWLSEILELVER